MKVAVKNLGNKTVGDIDLSESVFGLAPRADVRHKMVNWQLAKRRSGNHKTKGISEVSGTGKKPYAQKGSGRARTATLRSTRHVGGAVMFGPVVRDHAIDMPKNFRKLALKVALSAKQAEGKLIVLDAAKSKTHKTKDMVKAFAGLGLTSALIIDEALDQNFIRAVANIPQVDVLPQKGLNVYDILRRDTLVLTK